LTSQHPTAHHRIASYIFRRHLGLFEFCLIGFSAGHVVIPKYYYVPADFVEAEQKKHGSQKRFPSNSGRDGMLFLWGQALYNIAKLLGEFQIHPEPRGQAASHNTGTH